MTLLDPLPSFYTVEEYLRLEEASEQKHEYRHGQIVAMAGSTPAHSLIASNMIREAGNRLKGKPCRVYDSNLHIGIPRRPLYMYPDLSIVCGDLEFDPRLPGRSRTVNNPRVIVEILSESSEAYDRGKKFEWYREIPALQAYVLISQKGALVEIYQRLDDGAWRFEAFAGMDAVAKLPAVGIEIPLAEVYADVEFPPEESPKESNEPEIPAGLQETPPPQ